MTLPFPPQVFLTTYISDCNSLWALSGHTNIEIKGREIQSGCSILAPGIDTDDALLTVDFYLSSEPCTDGYSVEVDENTVVIGGATITFGRPFRDILLVGSPCDDIFHIKKTYSDTSSIQIIGGLGNGKCQTMSCFAITSYSPN